jgi:ribosomal protein S18 acetylase RimI-like enzyme
MVELQEFERRLDPRLPAGADVVDAYLEGLFQRCATRAGRLFVAEAGGQVVGFVSVLGDCRSDDPEESGIPYAYVDDLVVLPEFRGQGHGAALLSSAEAYAGEYGRATLRLRVKGESAAARDFYRRAGFREYEVELEKALPAVQAGR